MSLKSQENARVLGSLIDEIEAIEPDSTEEIETAWRHGCRFKGVPIRFKGVPIKSKGRWIALFLNESAAWEYRARFAKNTVAEFSDPYCTSLSGALGDAVALGFNGVLLLDGAGNILRRWEV